MNFIILLLSTITFLLSQDWNYSADILEKRIENNLEVRIFKSKNPTNQNVIISRDTVSIFTNQAKQYADLNELHLIGPVLMINGLDTLNCENMIYWYDRDSIQASGQVKFNFRNSQLTSDSLIYVETKGFRGYSFKTLGNSNLIDNEYKITADNILYNDDNQLMNLYSNAMVSSKKNGVAGEMINIIFNDSLIKKVDIKNNGYIYNNHYAQINDNYQLFKDEMHGNNIEVNMIDNNLDQVSINGMGRSIYYVKNELNDLMGYNKATGDTINLNYNQGALNFLNILGDARGEFNPEKGQTKIDTILNYKAEKISYDIINEETMLYKDVEIEYQNTKLNSKSVIIDWQTNFLYAKSDENNSQISSQNQKPIIGKNLEFDLIAKKGVITLGETTVGDGIYRSKTIFRQEPNIYHMHKSIYTTCDHDEPHYYFKTPKMKMLQGERIIAKPLILYIYDIPILGLPFAILPNKNSNRQSGWVMPSFGVSQSNGTYFQKFGYYWAPNDYLDSKVLIDFYDKDRLEIRGQTRYIKRYKYNGNISTIFKRELNKDVTNDITELFTNRSKQNFEIKWVHKHLIDPTQNLNINWTYVSSNDFYNEFGYDLNTRTKQKIQSSASYSKVWSQFNNRLSISISESYDLNADKLYPNQNEPVVYFKSRVIPNLNFAHTNSKIFGNGDKWYNSIYYSYSSKFSGIQNIGHINESADTIEYNSSVVHNINISAPNKFFNWLTINPSINLKEGWIFKYNIDNNPDNLKDGFKRRLTGNLSVSASTTLYGLFPINILNINSLRHVVYPTLSLTYSPNYNDTFFGYNFGYFKNIDDTSIDYFRNTMIGSTPEYENKRLNINIRNNFQMKLNDSTNTKVDFLTWNVNSGYNFNPSQSGIYIDVIKSRINLNIPNFLDIDFTMFHDPYKLDDNLSRTGNLSPFPILTYIQGATDISIAGFKKQSITLENDIDTLNRDEKASLFNSNSFFEPNINKNSIWNLDMRLGAKLQKISQGNQLSWDKTFWAQPILQLQLTERWKLTYAGQIDMISNQIISHNMYLYRSLHCWEFGLKWWPSGSGSGFLLNIRVKSPNLRDIKIRSSGGALFGY
tara:strand:- start:45732 stop:48989 length:3258 start_codon:yes stop_codon:yes gene_type:complete